MENATMQSRENQNISILHCNSTWKWLMCMFYDFAMVEHSNIFLNFIKQCMCPDLIPLTMLSQKMFNNADIGINITM
jgi:hypothetical protein